jgi:hypothetical protein
LIRRRRQREPSESTRVASGEAKIARTVQRTLWVAKVRENRRGDGTLLTETVLVFVGTHRQDFRVFDRDSRQLGVARRFQEKAAKLDSYSIYSADGAAALVFINCPAGWSGDFTVSDESRLELAALTKRSTFTSGLSVLVRGEEAGYLRPPGLRSGHVQDNKGRDVARITEVRRGFRYVVEIEPSLAGPLRTVAVVASIICQARLSLDR